MALLQRIQLLNTGPVSQNAYFEAANINPDIQNLHEPLTINEGDRVDFCTYFNLLNVDKWHKYTYASDITLRLNIKGKFRINLLNITRDGDNPVKTVIKTLVLTNEKDNFEITFPKKTTGLIGFELIAIEKTTLTSGGYYSPIKAAQLKDIRLALCICTYKREPFVEHTLSIINDFIFNDPDNPVRDSVKVYISDNGNTLDVKKLSSERVQIFPNINTGGAGGFSRAVLEATGDTQYSPTHCILADDDAVLNYSSIERTYLFTRALRPDFNNSIIGGTLWSLSRPNTVFASGELRTSDWNHNNPKRNLDILKLPDVLSLEREDPINYFGWWYCSAPVSMFKNSLAIPIFFQYDDVEFSLRNPDVSKITLPGVGLWHEELDIKYTPAKKYYWFRNESIVRSLYGTDSSTAKYASWVFRDVFNSILVYSYDDARLAMRAVQDFLKGPSWLMDINQESLNKEVLNSFTPLITRKELGIKVNLEKFHNDLHFNEPKIKTNIRKLLLNGLFLPPHRNTSAEELPVVKLEYPHPALLFRQSTVLRYNEFTEQGVFVKRNILKALQLLCKSIVLYITILLRYKSIASKYRTAHSMMISQKYWKDKLKI